jgi:uncharacterized protein involved in exopolysaccharide biosynthesis
VSEQAVRSATIYTDHNAESGISTAELFGRLWQRRLWIFASTLFFASVFTLIAFLMTPIYRAESVLVSAGAERNKMGSLSSTLGQFGGLASLAGINVGSADIETEEALAVLRSREFTERFIAEKNLMPILFYGKWDSAKNTWNVPEKKQPTPADAYKYMDNKVRHISRDIKTGLVTLQIDWKDREQAASWANAMVERINAEMRGRAITQADAYIDYLMKELAKTTDLGTRDAVNRLLELQIRQRMVATVTQQYAFRVIDRALAPDAKDKESPIKILYLLLGLILGGSVGTFAALIIAPRQTTGKLA